MNILIVDDHKMVRESLSDILKIYLNESNILNTDTIDKLIDADYISKFDIIILDVNLNNITKSINGIELTKDIIAINSDIKILILSGYNYKVYEKESKRAGAKGFLSKDESISKIVYVINIIHKGGKYFPNIEVDNYRLTYTELRIISYYCNGYARKEVANKCNISVSSLAVYLNKIYEKLDVSNYQELCKRVFEEGIV